MAAKESDLQTELMKIINGSGAGKAVKISDSYHSGFSDLCITYKGFSLWTELKFVERRPVSNNIPVKTTTNQKKFIFDWILAGGFAGWVVCVKEKKRELLFHSARPEIETFNISAVEMGMTKIHVIERKIGDKWDVDTLINNIVTDATQTDFEMVNNGIQNFGQWLEYTKRLKIG